MTATAYIEENGDFSKISWSLRAGRGPRSGSLDRRQARAREGERMTMHQRGTACLDVGRMGAR